MKISNRQYAQALLDCLQGKDKKASRAALADFTSLLFRQGALGRAGAIISEFSRLYDRESGLVRAAVAYSRRPNAATRALISGLVREISGGREAVLEESFDPGLLGGFIVRFGDQVFDASLKTKIRRLKEEMAK